MISNNLYDLFGVMRYEQGSAQTPWRWRKTSQDTETLLVVNDSRQRFYMPNKALVVQQAWGDFRDCPTYGGTFTKAQCEHFYGALNGWSALCEAMALQAKNECVEKVGLMGGITCTLICIPAGAAGGVVGGVVCSLGCSVLNYLVTADVCDARYSAKLSGCLNCFYQCLQSSLYPY